MQFLNRCAWVSVSGGTTSFVLASAKPGFYAPASCLAPAVIDDGTYNYFAVSSDGSQHEEGTGTWTVSTSTLTRTGLRNSSNSGSPTDFTSAPTIYMGGQVATDASMSVTGVKTIQITTGASPLVITPDENAPPITIYEVTSGGTGTDEYIHLLRYPYIYADFMNAEQVNKRIIFVMVAQTNPDDVVHTLLYAIDQTTIVYQSVLDAGDRSIGFLDLNIGGVLDYVGSPVAYVWFIDSWYFDLQSVDWNSNTRVQFGYQFFSGHDLGVGAGQVTSLRAGDAKDGSGEGGGEAQLYGGGGDGAGAGGPVSLIAGNGGVTGAGGHVEITAGLATSGVGGDVNVAAGDAQVVGTGGLISLTAGNGGANDGPGGGVYLLGGNTTSGQAGRILLVAGSANDDGGGGPISLVSGNSAQGNQGPPIELESGAGGATGDGGPIYLTAGRGGNTSGNGGPVTIVAGEAPNGVGGEVVILGGNGPGGGGQAKLQGGDGAAGGGFAVLRGGDALNDGGAGGYALVFSGAGFGTGLGGEIDISAGAGGATGNGGSVTINAGPAEITGNGGQINLTAGTGGSTSGHGGGIALISGIAQSIGNGGAVEILARNGGATSGNGGDITLTPGTATSGTAGHILLSRIQDFADDAAAATGGVPVTGLYRTGSVIKVRVA